MLLIQINSETRLFLNFMGELLEDYAESGKWITRNISFNNLIASNDNTLYS